MVRFGLERMVNFGSEIDSRPVSHITNMICLHIIIFAIVKDIIPAIASFAIFRCKKSSFQEMHLKQETYSNHQAMPTIATRPTKPPTEPPIIAPMLGFALGVIDVGMSTLDGSSVDVVTMVLMTTEPSGRVDGEEVVKTGGGGVV
jgi:hypothetical protein